MTLYDSSPIRLTRTLPLWNSGIVAKATRCDYRRYVRRLDFARCGSNARLRLTTHFRGNQHRANLSNPDCCPVGIVPTPHRRITKRQLQTRREGLETSPGKQVQACLRRIDASLEVIELTATGGLSPVGFLMVRCAKRAVETAITESAADEIARAGGKPCTRFPFCSRPGTALISIAEIPVQSS